MKKLVFAALAAMALFALTARAEEGEMLLRADCDKPEWLVTDQNVLAGLSVGATAISIPRRGRVGLPIPAELKDRPGHPYTLALKIKPQIANDWICLVNMPDSNNSDAMIYLDKTERKVHIKQANKSRDSAVSEYGIAMDRWTTITFAFGEDFTEIYFDGLDVHCFVAGTKILMSDNSTKNIEEIKRGDKILTFNKLTNKKEVATVEETASVKHNNLVTYTFEGGKTITATDDHPFMTKRGWASMNPSKSVNYKGFEQICRIKVGDKFVTNSGMLTLVSTSVSPESHTTYTITKLSDGNSFYANDLLVGVEEMK